MYSSVLGGYSATIDSSFPAPYRHEPSLASDSLLVIQKYQLRGFVVQTVIS